MVTKILLPSSIGLKRLSKLTAPLHIHKLKSALRVTGDSPALRAVLEAHGALFLVSAGSGNSIKVSVRYEDVVPKFEIFDLTFETAMPMTSDAAEMAVFENWDRITCVIAFEWLRPARPGENAISWDQSRLERGLRSEIPRTAEAVGVSMVGLAFSDAKCGQPVGMLYTDESDPCSLIVVCGSKQIGDLIADCECVGLQDFSEWKHDLKKWLASGGKDFAYGARNPVR